MEFKRIWMPYRVEFMEGFMYVSPCDNEDTTEGENEIKQHLKEGWRIVSTNPLTESRAYNKKGSCNMPNTGGSEMVYTYTCGLDIFLVKE